MDDAKMLRKEAETRKTSFGVAVGKCRAPALRGLDFSDRARLAVCTFHVWQADLRGSSGIG